MALGSPGLSTNQLGGVLVEVGVDDFPGNPSGVGGKPDTEFGKEYVGGLKPIASPSQQAAQERLRLENEAYVNSAAYKKQKRDKAARIRAERSGAAVGAGKRGTSYVSPVNSPSRSAGIDRAEKVGVARDAYLNDSAGKPKFDTGDVADQLRAQGIDPSMAHVDFTDVDDEGRYRVDVYSESEPVVVRRGWSSIVTGGETDAADPVYEKFWKLKRAPGAGYARVRGGDEDDEGDWVYDEGARLLTGSYGGGDVEDEGFAVFPRYARGRELYGVEHVMSGVDESYSSDHSQHGGLSVVRSVFYVPSHDESESPEHFGSAALGYERVSALPGAGDEDDVGFAVFPRYARGRELYGVDYISGGDESYAADHALVNAQTVSRRVTLFRVCSMRLILGIRLWLGMRGEVMSVARIIL